MSLTPRPYQTKLVDDCRAAFAAGSRAVLAVLPTGGGKTVVGALVVQGALDRGRGVLWLAHRRELVDQAAARMPGRVGVCMAGRRRDPGAPTQVASIDTITDWEDMPSADLIVYDEAHHIVAATSRALLSRWPAARILGLSATPERQDGAALGDVFQALVSGPSVRTLTDAGHLVEADVIGPAQSSETLAADPVEAWIKYAEGRPGFMFVRTIAKSREYADRLNAAGVPAAHVDGSTAKRTRDAAVEGFRAGKIDVLSSVGVFTEGVDLPRAAVALLAHTCGHAGGYLQRVGRVLRTSPGKSRALVIDLVGAAHQHGLPDDDREWSLSGEAIKLRDKTETLNQCPDCGAVWRPPRRECARCAWQMPEPPAPEVQEVPLEDLRTRLAGVLREYASPESKRAALERLRGQAREKGYREGWVGARYKAMFGHWPRG